MISILDLNPTEKLFTHIEKGVQTDLAVDRMIKWAVEHSELILVAIQFETANMITERKGLEPHRLHRALTYTHYDPLIWAHFPEDDSYLLCDGNHRYVAMAYRGIPFAASWILTSEQWKPFQVSGNRKYSSEAELMGRPSGIK